MVVPPQRDGGQRQYIDQPIPVRCSEGFAPQLDWILANLDKPHTVTTLARRANMSARTFARRFVEETGTTPMQWVTDQRVLFARRLLEESDLEIDRIADRAGFGNATLLRHHFPAGHRSGSPPDRTTRRRMSHAIATAQCPILLATLRSRRSTLRKGRRYAGKLIRHTALFAGLLPASLHFE